MTRIARLTLIILLILTLASLQACGGGNPLSGDLSPDLGSPFVSDVDSNGVSIDGTPVYDEFSGLNTTPNSMHLVAIDPPADFQGADFEFHCTDGTWVIHGNSAGETCITSETALEWRAPAHECTVQIVISPAYSATDVKLGFMVVVDVDAPYQFIGRPVPADREASFFDPSSGQIVVAASDELLVKLAPGVSLTEILSLRPGKDYSVLERVSASSPLFRLRMNPDVDLLSARDGFLNDPRIERVEFNYVAYPTYVPNDPDYPKKHEFPKIQAPEAWDTETGSSDVWVAVVDTGVDRDHPDLAANVVQGMDFIMGGDGYGGETDGDGVDNNSDGIVDQNVGHGTHVAGIVASIGDNGVGACGIAYNVKILPLRIFPANGDTGATFSSIIEAVNYAASAENVRVISMSIGTTYESDLLQEAIDAAWDAGKVLVAAAANSNTDTMYYPAAHDNVVAVAAINKTGEKASFSNYGSWVDISAYGTGIYSTYYNDSYAYMSGTSMATPLVSGCFALLFSNDPGLTNEQAVAILEMYTDDVYEANPDFLGKLGSGLVNPYLALRGITYSQPGDVGDADSDGSASGYDLELGPHAQG